MKLDNKFCKIRNLSSEQIEITEVSTERFLKALVNLKTQETQKIVEMGFSETLMKHKVISDCIFLGSCRFESFQIDFAFFFEKTNKKIFGMSFSKIKRIFRIFSFYVHEKVRF